MLALASTHLGSGGAISARFMNPEENSQPSVDERFQTSLGLLAGAAAQNPEAWSRFVKLYYPLVLRWCRQSGLDDAEADCVTYDVLLLAVSKLNKFRKDEPGQMFRKWIRTITRNTLVNYSRQRVAKAAGGSGRWFNEIAFDQQDDEESLRDDIAVLFQRALDIIKSNTNPKHYRAFVEVVVHERKPKEVAADLGLNPNVVYQVKCRILQKLKAEFASLF